MHIHKTCWFFTHSNYTICNKIEELCRSVKLSVLYQNSKTRHSMIIHIMIVDKYFSLKGSFLRKIPQMRNAKSPSPLKNSIFEIRDDNLDVFTYNLFCKCSNDESWTNFDLKLDLDSSFYVSSGGWLKWYQKYVKFEALHFLTGISDPGGRTWMLFICSCSHYSVGFPKIFTKQKITIFLSI